MAEDKILKCKDCGEQFTFTVGEQDFYAQKGFENDPVRCAPCRKARKTQRGGGGQYGSREPYASDSFGRGEGLSYGSSYNRGQY